MHRFGQRLRREILKPEGEDHHHGTTGQEEEAEDQKALRARLEEFEGERIRKEVEGVGVEGVLEAIVREKEKAGEGDVAERVREIWREEIGEGKVEEEDVVSGKKE